MKYLSNLLLAAVTAGFFALIFYLRGNEIQPTILLTSFIFGIAVMPITIRLPVFKSHYIKDKMVISDQRNSFENTKIAPVACGLFSGAVVSAFFYLLNSYEFFPYALTAAISSASISFYYEP